MEIIKLNGVQLSPKAINSINALQLENGSLIDHFNESIHEVVAILSDKDSLGIQLGSDDLLEYIHTLISIGQTLKSFKINSNS